jgi:uncharacterized protein YjiS (DUF1127 family)
MRPNYIDLERHRWRGTYRPKDEYSFCRAVAEALRGGARLLGTWRRRARERHELAGLDYRMRRDIGVSPSEVARECARPFWRPSSTD